MTVYILLSVSFVGVAAFVSLKPRHKVFLSLFVMTACFNAVPRWIHGIDIWDVGAVMLMISAAHVALMKPKSAPIRAPYLQMLKMFTVWCVLSLLWAILICGYPPLDTLKASRQLIIGYLSVFVFLRLWRVDPGAFESIWRAVYWSTYGFLIVCVVQYLSGKEILFMTSGEYEGLTRRIPFFLPLCLAYLWVITARLLGGGCC